MSALNKESKRVRNFREEIIKHIPRLSNNGDTVRLLEAKSLIDLLLVYLNWASRHVLPRSRTIHIEPTLTALTDDGKLFHRTKNSTCRSEAGR